MKKTADVALLRFYSDKSPTGLNVVLIASDVGEGGLPHGELKEFLEGEESMAVISDVEIQGILERAWLHADHPARLLAEAELLENVALSVAERWQRWPAGIANTLRQSRKRTKGSEVLMLSQTLLWMLCAFDGHTKNFSIELLVGSHHRLTPLQATARTNIAVETEVGRTNSQLAAHTKWHLVDGVTHGDAQRLGLLEREIAQPSLLLNTISGLLRSSDWNTRSQLA